MPNYSLVSNALFQPFTYQELAAPLDRQELYEFWYENKFGQGFSEKSTDLVDAAFLMVVHLSCQIQYQLLLFH